MPCEDLRESLTRAAAEGGAPTAELSAHVDVCPVCRAFFEEERQLFSAIDSGVHAAANAKVPPSFLANVRVQLNEHASSTRVRFPAWMAVAAAAALTVAVVFRSVRHETQQQSPASSQVAHAASVAPPDAPSTPEGAIARSQRRKAAAMPKTRQHAGIQPPVEQFTVLVPSGQKAAVDSLILNLRRGKVDGADLVAQTPEAPVQKLQIAPIEVSPIVVKPLEETSGKTPAKPEKTR